MNKFIVKSSLFIFPFFILYILNLFLYNPNEGDLVRLGYIYSNSTPKSKIDKQFHLHKSFTLLSEIELNTPRKFDVITIGDSFSEQDELGYQSFLGKHSLKVLHVDQINPNGNPIQNIVELLNSAIFDQITTNYIVIQSVERAFNQRNKEINFDQSVDLNILSDRLKNLKKEKQEFRLKFFSKATLKAPANNIQFLLESNPKLSQVYLIN